MDGLAATTENSNNFELQASDLLEISGGGVEMEQRRSSLLTTRAFCEELDNIFGRYLETVEVFRYATGRNVDALTILSYM